MHATNLSDPGSWLQRHAASGVSTEAAVAFYDELPAVQTGELIGRWRGSGLPTAHPWDGLLEATGWYGKEFVDAETVHPLLFSAGGGRVVAVSPRLAPLGLLSRLSSRLSAAPPVPRFALRPALALWATRRPAARLRMTEHRGVVTATMT
jgi:GXWXG protein